MPAGNGKLGSTPAFQKALPHAAGASVLGYYNLGALLDADTNATDAKQKRDWAHLSAVGLSVNGSAFTMRLTTR